MIKVEFKLDYCSASILFHERFFLKRRLNKFSKLIIKLVFGMFEFLNILNKMLIFLLTKGVYMTVTLIVLINLLIAMMSNTYQRIEAQSDIEW